MNRFVTYIIKAKPKNKKLRVDYNDRQAIPFNRKLMVCNKIEDKAIDTKIYDKSINNPKKERNRKNKWGENSKDWRPTEIDYKDSRMGCFYSYKSIEPNLATRKNFRRIEAAESKLKDWYTYGDDHLYEHSIDYDMCNDIYDDIYDDMCNDIYEDEELWNDLYNDDIFNDMFNDEPTIEELWNDHESAKVFEELWNDQEDFEELWNDQENFEELVMDESNKNRKSIRKVIK